MFTKRRWRKIEVRTWQCFCFAWLALLASAGIFFAAQAKSGNPRLANYYLGTLPTDFESIQKLARNDVLILSPEQALTRRDAINVIKRANPEVILLAYVPSQSYNAAWTKYPANVLYKNFTARDEWWLRDSAGKIVEDFWPGLRHTNMSAGWSDYLINFVKDNILSSGVWDGVFFDMVYDGIGSFNDGDIDLDGDGRRDDAAAADKEWVSRTVYLLEQSRARLPVKYILINGSSLPAYQPSVNGRMYENFPTPWEAGGSWSGIMSGLMKNTTGNQPPRLYVFNANTNNSGNRSDWRRMRFGLGSSLLLDDVYFSFDFGTKDHGQIWWYDEYDVNLGAPAGAARSLNNRSSFAEDVWRRDYAHGVALVNPSQEAQTVDLGGDFEKINGEQDRAVNDGTIVDRVRLNGRDGLVLLKTFQTVDNVVFNNGSFLRFLTSAGRRARNGFFAFEDGVPGGAKVFHGDLDNDGQPEKIIASGNRLRIVNSQGGYWYDDYPFGADFKGEMQLAVGRLGNDWRIILSSSDGRAAALNYHGEIAQKSFYLLGKKQKDGLAVAIGGGEVIFTTGKGAKGEVVIFDADLKKIKRRFFPYEKTFTGGVKVAVGDVNGDGKTEIITVPSSKRKLTVRVFTAGGKKLSEFAAGTTFGASKFSLGAADVNFDGKDEVVVMNE